LGVGDNKESPDVIWSRRAKMMFDVEPARGLVILFEIIAQKIAPWLIKVREIAYKSGHTIEKALRDSSIHVDVQADAASAQVKSSVKDLIHVNFRLPEA